MAGFIKKNWQKDAGDVAIKAGERAVGAIGTAFILAKVFNAEPKDGTDKEKAAKTSKLMYNIGGPIMVGLGLLTDMMADNGHVRAFAQGMTTYAVMHSIAVIADRDQSSNNNPGLFGFKGLKGIPAREANLFGLGKMGAAAIGTTKTALGATNEDYTGSNPEEFNLANGLTQPVDSDGKTYNNDWGYLAENIDVADQITKTVNGVDEEAAALMGVNSPEEAAALVDMF